MDETPLAGRSARQVGIDAVGGTATGFTVAIAFTAWVVFVNQITEGVVEERYELTVWHLASVYFGGLSFAGLVGGLLRPWLGTLWGRAALCWATAFTLYGGVQLVMPPLFGTPFLGGVIMATLATPIWLATLKFWGYDQDLREVAGLPRETEVAEPESKPLETWTVYRSRPDGGKLRISSQQGKQRAAQHAARLRARGLPHHYWIER